MWVLNRVEQGTLIARQAAEVLGLSLRQVRRLLRSYRKRGAAALVHGNRDRGPKHRIKNAIRRRVVQLARTVYEGANQQHLSELLAEREDVKVSRSSVRRILQEAGIQSPKKQKRRRRHHQRRERRPVEGMLVQIDGSKHHWFGSGRQAAVLLTAEDDATGKILGAVFRQQEDAHGYFLLLRALVEGVGCPLALYHDQHGIFQVNMKKKPTLEEELRGENEPTQFGRLLKELGIRSIAATTPQAKGRVERVFGTFQDRLVLELKLDKVQSIDEGNQFLAGYLERHNRRFGVPAAESGVAYQRLPGGCDLDATFSFQYRRTVGQDNTVRFGSERLQILADGHRASYTGARVQVQQRLDGSLKVFYQGRCLASRPAPLEAPRLRAQHQRWKPDDTIAAASGKTQKQRTAKLKRPRVHKPTAEHPWKQSYQTMKTPQSARRQPAAFPLAAGVLRRSPT